MTQHTLRSTPLVLALLAAGALGGAGVEALQTRAHAQPVPVTAPAVAGITASASTMPDFPRITQEYGPAVVNISVTGTEKTAMQVGPEAFNGDPLEFFRYFQGQGHVVPVSYTHLT